MSEEIYFRVPVFLRVRTRRALAKGPLSPSLLSTLRADLETQLQACSLDVAEKELTQKLFELVLGVDVRLCRIEEQLETIISKETEKFEKFKGVAMELGAQGFLVNKSDWPFGAEPESTTFEFLLPLVPEWSCLARLSLIAGSSDEVFHFRFQEIHGDDREMIHRYVRSRERELLRARKANA